MQNLLVIMDMNNGFAKKGNLFSPRTANLIDPIADYCKKSKEKGWTILALSDTHDPQDIEMKSFPSHCLAGSDESEVVDEIKPYCDFILPKFTTGGFFEIQEASQENKSLDLRRYEEIHVVGCCTDLCVFNFCLITQKHMEYEYHKKRISRIPVIIVHKDLVDTYDSEGHEADKLNRFFWEHMKLNGIKVE